MTLQTCQVHLNPGGMTFFDLAKDTNFFHFFWRVLEDKAVPLEFLIRGPEEDLFFNLAQAKTGEKSGSLGK